MKTRIILALILTLAFGLRFIDLAELPSRPFGDEVDVGYHAWSIWTTGKDYSGNMLPTYIRSLSEYRAPLLMYVVAPFVGLLGPSNMSIRLASVITGTLTVWLVYLVGIKLFLPASKNHGQKAAWIAAFVTAVSPWHIHYSRTTFEVSLLVFLIFLGLYLYFYIDRVHKTCLFLIPWALTFYTYSTANVFVPLMGLGLVLFDKKIVEISKNKLAIFAVAFFIALPSLLNLFNGKAGARFGLISIFGNQTLVDEVIVARTKPWATNEDKIFNNKYIRITQEFANNYLTAWSPHFLFIQGDPEPRHNVFGFGEFSMALAPLLILGLAAIIFGKSRETKLLGYFLIIAPISSSLTYAGGNHATRLFVFMPFLALTMGLGAITFYRTRKTLLLMMCLVVVCIGTVGWWRQMSKQYVFETQRSWQYGYQELFEEFAKIDDGKGKVYVNNTKEPSLIRFAFYTKLSPQRFLEMFKGDQMTDLSPGLIGFEFGDRYIFGKMRFEDMGNLAPGDYYLAAQGQEIPGDMDLVKSPLNGYMTIKKISDSYGLPLFYILKKNEI